MRRTGSGRYDRKGRKWGERSISDEKVKEMSARRKEGATLRAIAKEFGVSESSVARLTCALNGRGV